MGAQFCLGAIQGEDTLKAGFCWEFDRKQLEFVRR